jgi:hypothetical protein
MICFLRDFYDLIPIHAANNADPKTTGFYKNLRRKGFGSELSGRMENAPGNGKTFRSKRTAPL